MNGEDFFFKIGEDVFGWGIITAVATARHGQSSDTVPP